MLHWLHIELRSGLHVFKLIPLFFSLCSSHSVFHLFLKHSVITSISGLFPAWNTHLIFSYLHAYFYLGLISNVLILEMP